MDFLKEILDFVLKNIPSLLVIIGFVIILSYAYFRLGKKGWVYRKLFTLVTMAEKEFGSGTGKIKYNYVLDQFYTIMPKILKLLITRKLIDEYIQIALKELKDALENGMTLYGYEKEQQIKVSFDIKEK